MHKEESSQSKPGMKAASDRVLQVKVRDLKYCFDVKQMEHLAILIYAAKMVHPSGSLD
jgi:hypothetical protein